MASNKAQKGKIVRISGPVVDIEGLTKSQLYELVHVGEEGLMGEIIRIVTKGDRHIATTQVYEETAGLIPGDPAEATGNPLSVELGPGLIGQIYDGIQRPLPTIKSLTGDFIKRGISAEALDRSVEYNFIPLVSVGDQVFEGSIIGQVEESPVVKGKILTPPKLKKAKITEIAPQGTYNIEKVIAKTKNVRGHEISLKMYHIWPVRQQRPFKQKLATNIPLVTGQRIYDTFFPIPKGGTGAIPGGFGTGKTVSQHQLAKWSDATVVVYIGCGERGNEMTEVLEEFPNLEDPRTGEKLMKRTVLIANTSNMPVAAREASIYTGITMAEYYRDQGFDVALMADSTSRWAEALREISGRLEEMPGEEGYPAYLASKVAEFYERAGRVITLSGEKGSISAVGAVSPPGGDFSEPVTQSTLRTVRVFWALSKRLASARHFPAIDWLGSYSLYAEDLSPWFTNNVSSRWAEDRQEALAILQEEKRLQEIVQLVGPDALPETDKATLQIARMLREDLLQQHAYSEEDSYCSLEKQGKILEAIIQFGSQLRVLQQKGVPVATLIRHPVLTMIARMKWLNKKPFEDNYQEICTQITRLPNEFSEHIATSS
ncbi:MAG: V-type ATP synthase subunit A [Candidatus Hodarchaeota archaeon]